MATPSEAKPYEMQMNLISATRVEFVHLQYGMKRFMPGIVLTKDKADELNRQSDLQLPASDRAYLHELLQGLNPNIKIKLPRRIKYAVYVTKPGTSLHALLNAWYSNLLKRAIRTLSACSAHYCTDERVPPATIAGLFRMLKLSRDGGIEEMFERLAMPYVAALLKAEPQIVPWQSEAGPVSPSPAKAGAASRTLSKGRQTSSTPTKVLQCGLDTSEGLQGCKDQSEDVAGPSQASKTTIHPVVGASRSLLLTVGAQTVNLLLRGQDQALTLPHTCTAPLPHLLRLESSTDRSTVPGEGPVAHTSPHLPSPLPPSSQAEEQRLKSSTASICCSVGRIRRSHLPTPAQPPPLYLLRQKNSTVLICCSGGRIRRSQSPTPAQPPLPPSSQAE